MIEAAAIEALRPMVGCVRCEGELHAGQLLDPERIIGRLHQCGFQIVRKP